MIRVPFFDLKRQYQPLRKVILSELTAICEDQKFILGSRAERLEDQIAKIAGVPYGIACSSGTDALLLILMGLGIGAGDAVVTTPYTFFATAGCIVRLGARPIFVDIEPGTLQMSGVELEIFLREQCELRDGETRTADGLRVKAIVPVHLFGLCAEMDLINRIGAEYGIKVVEDAAQAIGANYPSKTGTKGAAGLGVAGFFSFYPTKNLGAFGDAGMVVTQDEQLARRMYVLRNHGMEPKYHHAAVGGNFRMDELQAGVLLQKLPYLAEWSQQRWEIAQKYRKAWSELAPDLMLPAEPYQVSLGSRGHIYHQFIVQTRYRDQLRQELADHGIGTDVYYPVALHQQPCLAYLGYAAGDFPVAEQAAAESLALPIFPELRPDEIDHVTTTVRQFFHHVRN